MLKFTVDSLEGIPEAAKAFYAEKDGKFTLQVEGAESAESVNGLKTALVKERENAGRWAKFGKPEDLDAKMAELEARAAKGGKGGEEAQQIIDQMKTQHANELKARDERITAMQGRQAMADLKAELARNGVVPEGLDLLANFGNTRIRFNDDGTPKVLAADGQTPMIGSGANGGATLADLAKELASSIPHLVKDAGAGGGGKPPGSGGKQAATIKRSEFDALPPAQRVEAMKNGTKVTD